MADTKKVLILGATGGIGGEVMRQLCERGWDVHALRRGEANLAGKRDGVTWVIGDAMDGHTVMAAAQGCSVIVHAVNPPGYLRWAELVLPMLDNTIAAAKVLGATIVLPGTLYNFGPSAFPLVNEHSPQKPVSRKGAIRVELEERLRTATTRGCRVIILRAGEFFGPKAVQSWFAQALVKPGQPVNHISLPGAPGVGHQWAYLPDAARTMAMLLECRGKLLPFAVFHMNGHWDNDGNQMAEAICRVVNKSGGAQPKLRRFPWWFVRLASPFMATFREMLELRYMWRVPAQMTNSRLLATLGHEPHTPLDQAVEATLVGMRCLPKRHT
ncbi:NAD(P)H-binding protein [Pseudomonas sp. ES3-33]|uniref:NAD(P)H-binding protein n=1 Tax=Pseudomonas sp. ES3-33 TaxID=1628833 RepID=UPI0005D301B4|nr:NAD(P)H-binding protein [Pseudomonas sp. ES3-33]KJH77461.1 membrane protein [Pseudomonas sp. ES3-33]